MNETFGWALKQMQNGTTVCRQGWNGKGMWIFLVLNWEISNTSETFPKLPFIAMKTADNKIVPWLASQTDMLAVDWTVTG